MELLKKEKKKKENLTFCLEEKHFNKSNSDVDRNFIAEALTFLPCCTGVYTVDPVPQISIWLLLFSLLKHES